MFPFQRLVGSSTANMAATYLYDPTSKASPEEMHHFLRDVKYPFVFSEYPNPEQVLIDCIIADALGATILQKNYGTNWSYRFFNEDDARIWHSELPESTRERLNIELRRSTELGGFILRNIDQEADWKVRALQAAWMVCQISTEKPDGIMKTRKNDGRQYSYHPLETATILYEAMQRVMGAGIKIPDIEQIAILVTALMHDAPEDWVKDPRHYNLTTDIRDISPLLIMRLMSTILPSKTLPSYIASATRRMAHNKEVPWQQTYDEFIEQLKSSFLAEIVKFAGDNYHNYQIDRLEEPVRKPGEEEGEYYKRLDKFYRKQRSLERNIFDDSVALSKHNNAFIQDSRGRAYGIHILRAVRGMVRRCDDENRHPLVDWSKAIPFDEFKGVVLPEWVSRFRERYLLPEPATQVSEIYM